MGFPRHALNNRGQVVGASGVTGDRGCLPNVLSGPSRFQHGIEEYSRTAAPSEGVTELPWGSTMLERLSAEPLTLDQAISSFSLEGWCHEQSRNPQR